MHLQRRRRTFTSSRKSESKLPGIAWRLLQGSFVVSILVWMGGVVHFLANDKEHHDNGLSLGDTEAHCNVANTSTLSSGQERQQHIVALDLDLNPQHNITIRISVMSDKCPKAYEFLT